MVTMVPAKIYTIICTNFYFTLEFVLCTPYFFSHFFIVFILRTKNHNKFWHTNHIQTNFDKIFTVLLTMEFFLSRLCSWGMFNVSFSTNIDRNYEKYPTRFLKNNENCKSLPWIFSSIVHVERRWVFPSIRRFAFSAGLYTSHEPCMKLWIFYISKLFSIWNCIQNLQFYLKYRLWKINFTKKI